MLDTVLEDDVREKRAWAYHIACSLGVFRQFSVFSIDCESLAIHALDEIEQVIEECIVSLASREDLFEQVKQRALSSHHMIDPTGRSICAGALDDLADEHRIVTYAEIGNDLKRVTMDDIRSALQWLVPERRWTLLTRP